MKWLRLTAGAVVWALVYNAVWGAAWFVFMRREWLDASAAAGQGFPWTAEVWLVWLALTLPFGAALVIYIAGPSAGATKRAIGGTVAVWSLMTAGMVVWGLSESLSVRILTLDSLVNLAALLAGSFAGARVMRALGVWAVGGSHTRELT